MASFAQLDESNKVINVIKISNDEILDENGNESEEMGIQRCQELFGKDTKWVQTFFGDTETTRRGNPASIGSIYVESLDAFTSRKNYNSWILNEETLTWEPPIPRPDMIIDRPITHQWNEETLSWDEVDIPKPDNDNEYEWNNKTGVWDIVLPEEPVGIATT